MKITVDLDLQEIIDDSVYEENTFKEEFSSVLKSAIVAELKSQCADAVMKQIAEPMGKQIKDISDAIAKEILESDFKTRKFKFKIGHSSKEPKPAEPKYHVGQMVRCLNDGEIYIVLAKVGKHHYSLQGVEHDVHEDYLEPYTEPKEDHIVVNNEMVKDFDTILKDSFSKERRLNIAAIIAGGMAFNWCIEPQGGNLRDKCQSLAKLSLMVTDNLIKEAEKGGKS